MQTSLPEVLLQTAEGRRADEILRACVHCGFCNATCPTYQMTGDELDGPRGRIYLIKSVLEGGEQSGRLNQHLDRCLTCRACETTCPSGVQYGELAEIARNRAEDDRSRWARILRSALLWLVPQRRLLTFLVGLGGVLRPLVPQSLKALLPERRPSVVTSTHTRKVVLLQGCAQSALTPEVVAWLAELLDRRGIEAVLVGEEGCCGALPLHLGEEARAAEMMARNVAALSPMLDDVEAVVSSASGCGVTVKDYGRLLPDDPRAAEVAARTQDVAEFLAALEVPLEKASDARRIAWSSPCTLQHGQKQVGVVERLLTAAGYELVPVADPHLCCGSAGTYSFLQRDMALELRRNKLAALEAAEPELIATANVGCHTHLAAAATVPVVHWTQLVR